MEIEERIEQAQRSALPARLLRGARILGRLWQGGPRCADGWSRRCSCTPKTESCVAKLKWIEMVLDYGPDQLALASWTGDEPYFVIEAMTVSQFEATGLTVRVDIPGRGIIAIGPKGTCWKTLTDLAQVPEQEEDEAWKAVMMIQRMFGPKGVPK